MKCYILLGCKFGDICSALPIIFDEYNRSGEKPAVLVSRKYASILEGCSYVKPEVWQGDWDDVRAALIESKKIHDDVVLLSTHGKDWTVEKRHHSFQLDQYARGNRLELFGQLPLVFDNRKPERETMLARKHMPVGATILYCFESESSPFEHGAELLAELKNAFPHHHFVNLAEISAERIYDLIGLYDRAMAIVSIETVHLHLSAAAHTPVIALATDKPEVWHGTAYQDRFAFHCRYQDYELKKRDIVRALKQSLACEPSPKIEQLPVRGYNPSIINFQGKMVLIYRDHPVDTSWRTQLVGVEPPPPFREYSIEDGRLFMFKGKPHLSYTVGRTTDNQHRCVVQYGELVNSEKGWRIVNWKQPKYGKNDFSGMEKNFSFWSHDGKLYCAYQRAPEQIVLELDGDKVVKEHRTISPDCNYGIPRGGTHPIPYKDGLIQFFHTCQNNRKSAWYWNYYMGALIMENEPPFAIREISKTPILAGTEKYYSGWRFWKPKVTIPYGAIAHGNYWQVSIGINDSVCAFAKVFPQHLNFDL